MLYKEDKSLRWPTKRNYKYPTEFEIENNGNLVLYSQSGSIVLQSDTRCKHTDYSTNRRGVSDDDVDEEEEEFDNDYEHYSYEEEFDDDEDFDDSEEQADRSRGGRPRSYSG